MPGIIVAVIPWFDRASWRQRAALRKAPVELMARDRASGLVAAEWYQDFAGSDSCSPGCGIFGTDWHRAGFWRIQFNYAIFPASKRRPLRRAPVPKYRQPRRGVGLFRPFVSRFGAAEIEMMSALQQLFARTRRTVVVAIIDLAMIPLAWFGAHWLRFNLGTIPPAKNLPIWRALGGRVRV